MSGAAPGGAERLLTFRAGGERYGVPAARVREVARLPRVARVPHAPAGLIGLANFRGAVLPVVSFASLVDAPADEDAARVILLEGARPVGLAVDGVEAVAPADGSARQVDVDRLLGERFGTAAEKKGGGAVLVFDRAEALGDAVVPLLVFGVAGQEFALPLGQVERVLALPAQIAAVPHADAAVVGSTSHDGEVLPLLSIAALLGLAGEESGARPRVIVARIGAHRVGLVADGVRAVLQVAEDQIDTVPQVLNRGGAEARIQAICRLDEGRRLVSVLAVEQLLHEEQTARLLQGVREREGVAMADAEEAMEQLLLFRIGEEAFALPVGAVEEVAALPETLTRLPKAPAFVQGLMNLRGRVVPVIDQAMRFGGQAAAAKRRRVIVVRIGEMEAGFTVDAVSEVLRVPVSALREAPELGGEGTRVFDRVATVGEDGRMVLIVSPRELLDRAERELIAGLVGKAAAAAQ